MIDDHEGETMIQIAVPTVKTIDAIAKKICVRLATWSGMSNRSADAPSRAAAECDDSTSSNPRTFPPSLRAAARSVGRALLLCQGGTRLECVEDDAGEQAFEAADRFAAALPFASFAFEVGARRFVHAGLRDRDAVERGVELAVAASVEPVA